MNSINGTFIAGEALKYNSASGSTFGTIAAGSISAPSVKAYGFGDVKSYNFTAGGGTADAVLDVKVALPGAGPILSSASGSGAGATATITATLSNFMTQLRIGDVV